MQDRYAGDVGDFGKFSLLRALSVGRSLGVCWYRCSGMGEMNNDGRHVSYLSQPEKYRMLDPVVFDAMSRVVKSRRRSIAALETEMLLPGATYHGIEVPNDRADREVWFNGLVSRIGHCDLVFADMDNGFEWKKRSPKCIGRSEVTSLRRTGRSLLFYHHQTRRKGGAREEYSRFVQWLFDAGARHVEAVRLRPYSSRFYLLVDADDELSTALSAFAEKWGSERAEYFGRVAFR